MPMLKRPCKFCGARDAVRATTLTEPNEVEWEVREDGFEHMIVLSTQRSRYTNCTECGARDA